MMLSKRNKAIWYQTPVIVTILTVWLSTLVFHQFAATAQSNSGNKASQASITVLINSNTIYQTMDGFGTCLSGTEAQQQWWQQLYYDDLRASILRVDLTPRLVSPYSDNTYNSPWFHNNPPLPGPDGNNVRTYTGPNDYSRSFNGRNAPIAVMKSDANQNIPFFDYDNEMPKTGGTAAQAGNARRSQLGDFKLVGSLWSPVPWVKVSSGNAFGGSNWPLPTGGTRWPFIWADNFAGGKLDVSGQPLAVFNDGTGNTSSLTQFARSTAAYILGYQRKFNLKFYAISIQNELNFEQFYNSLTYPQSPEYLTAVKAVRAEFDKYAELRDIKLMGPEDLMGGDAYAMWEYGGGATHKNLQYIKNIEADPQAAAAVSFYNVHGYAPDGVSSSGSSPQSWLWWANGWTTSPAPGLPETVRGFKSYGKKSWMTETSGEDAGWLAPANSFPGNGAWSIALKIHQALTSGEESAWIYWQLTDGSAVKGETLTDSTLRANSPKYAAFKHFARFIRPNAQRVAVSVAGTNTLNASAYVHAANKSVTAVLVNSSPESETVTLQLPAAPTGIASLQTFTSSNNNLWQAATTSVSGNTATVTVPGYGVTTLYGVGNTTPPPPPPGGSGTGLRGEYFNNINLNGSAVLTRTDAAVNFDWGGAGPGGAIGADNFSVRWTGEVQAPVGGAYTFATTSDDGVRLWVNNQQIIDNWTDHPPTINTAAPITLAAGQKYALRMEFYERTGGATTKLLWSHPGQAQQIVPQSRLYPAGGGTTPPGEWTFCANEFEQCNFSGTREVRYGGAGQYFYRTLTNGTACTNAVFGDPINGTTKQCHYRSPTSGTNVVNRVRFFPRAGFAARMIGGRITGSNTSQTNDFVTLATIASEPPEGAWSELTFNNTAAYRYVKYESPVGGWGNIAELEFYNVATRINGTGFGTSGSWNNAGSTFDKALDANAATFFDAPFADGSYVGIDTGAANQVAAPVFSPTPGTYSTAQTVTISSATAGAQIRFSTGGAVLTCSSGTAGNSLTVSVTTTISAIACKSGLADSTVSVATYNIGTAPPSQGQKTYHLGNSLTDTINNWLDPIADSAGYNHTYHRSTIPGAPTDWIWDHPGQALGEPDYRVVYNTLAPLNHQSTQPFSGHCRTVENEADYSGRFYQLARERSPNVQHWLYIQWTSKTLDGCWWTRGTATPGWANTAYTSAVLGLAPANTWEQTIDNHVKYTEAVRQLMDDQNGGKPILIVPGGLALGKLKQAIEAGQVPGMTDFFAETFQPAVDEVHLNSKGAYLVSLTFFACIYKRSPEGIVSYANTGLTAEQARAFQRIAWNTVRNYKWSGVAP